MNEFTFCKAQTGLIYLSNLPRTRFESAGLTLMDSVPKGTKSQVVWVDDHLQTSASALVGQKLTLTQRGWVDAHGVAVDSTWWAELAKPTAAPAPQPQL